MRVYRRQTRRVLVIEPMQLDNAEFVPRIASLKKGEFQMDFSASLKRAIKTGNVVIGPDRTEKSFNEGTARMIILANNCSTDFKTKINAKQNPFIHQFDGSSTALGAACGKPFCVSTLAIISPGESDILGRKLV
ncbi:MAG: 50S ribosomal protein L30e [Methanomicrobiales archaeon]